MCLFIVINLYLILYCNNLSFNWNLLKIVLNRIDNNKNSVVDVSYSIVNIKNIKVDLHITVEAEKIVFTSLTTATGMKAGLELAKNIPNIGAKIALVIGTSITTQTINITTNRL